MNRIGLACMMLLLALPAQAQTVLVVPFGSARLVWDVGAPASGKSIPEKHVLTCGANSVEITMPATSIPINAVVPGPGIYTCDLYAVTKTIRQIEPNVPFPKFEAGYEPSAPVSLRLEVR